MLKSEIKMVEHHREWSFSDSFKQNPVKLLIDEDNDAISKSNKGPDSQNNNNNEYSLRNKNMRF